MRVSVFKPQKALGVWRSILWSRCLSELLEPAQPGQLSCQKGESCEAVGASWIFMGQSYCKNLSSCVGFGVTVSIQTQVAQKVQKTSSSELNKTVMVHISAEELQLVPLSSRANCPGYECVCVSAGVCVLSNQIHLTKFCGVLLRLN